MIPNNSPEPFTVREGYYQKETANAEIKVEIAIPTVLLTEGYDSYGFYKKRGTEENYKIRIIHDDQNKTLGILIILRHFHPRLRPSFDAAYGTKWECFHGSLLNQNPISERELAVFVIHEEDQFDSIFECDKTRKVLSTYTIDQYGRSGDPNSLKDFDKNEIKDRIIDSLRHCPMFLDGKCEPKQTSNGGILKPGTF